MDEIDKLIAQAAVNPYVIVIGFILAVIAAWQPVLGVIGGIVRFSRGVYRHGVVTPIKAYLNAVDRIVDRYNSHPDKVTKFIVIDIALTIYQIFFIAICFSVVGAAVFIAQSNTGFLKLMMQIIGTVYGFIGAILFGLTATEAGIKARALLEFQRRLKEHSESSP